MPAPKLPFFPVPADGETVFSVAGRCAERLGIANRDLLSILTGQPLATTLFAALPGHLNSISSAMPNGHPWSDVSEIILKHTAFYYFTYFHSKFKKNEIFEMLKRGESPNAVFMTLGLTSYRIYAKSSSPRFCILCAHEQAQAVGFAYFHIAHQLPGICCCWKHGLLLAEGCVHCGAYPLPGKRLTMPGQCNCNNFTPKIFSYRELGLADKWLAKNSASTLNSLERENRVQRLRDNLITSGYGRGRLINYATLCERIQERFGKPFLDELGYPTLTDGKVSPWLARYFSSIKSDRRTCTIAGLIIAGAAVENVSDLDGATICPKKLTFSDAYISPPTSDPSEIDRYLRSHKYRISACAASLGKTPWQVAIEARDAGVTVPLSNRLLSRVGELKVGEIKDELFEGIEKSKIMLSHGISEWTLLLIELSTLDLMGRRKESIGAAILHKHREIALEHLQQGVASKSLLMKILPGTYDFLIKNDKAWFQSTFARVLPKKNAERKSVRNWHKTDLELTKLVRKIADEMTRTQGKPVRITKTSLLRQIGASGIFASNKMRLVHLGDALFDLVESKDEYQLRKIKWALRSLIEAGEEISLENLRRKANLAACVLRPRLSEIRQCITMLGGVMCEKSRIAKGSAL